MKFVILLSLIMTSSVSFALGSLECIADDGSSITSVIDVEAGSMPINTQYTIRQSEPKKAEVSYYTTTQVYRNGFGPVPSVKSMVLVDPSTKELVMVITDGALVDKTGNYEVNCSFNY